ncbi:hypothetical protein BCT65_006280 [Vibrio splendidus]|uniref:hypothetical protein n=1 Tax=Vibrio splendidus TaxID=29497 RepID=UPI000C84920C|nr:hypothetical protein [Vibrio splendidus]MCC5516669.1 hypothetical protein [Vibrio splendidus]
MPWELARPHLLDALDGYDPSAEVEAGRAFAFHLDGAYMLVRTEDKELVVIAFNGVHKLKNASQIIIQLAKQIKARSIRVHTKRRGEQRFLNSNGCDFQLAEKCGEEFILRMVINGR